MATAKKSKKPSEFNPPEGITCEDLCFAIFAHCAPLKLAEIKKIYADKELAKEKSTLLKDFKIPGVDCDRRVRKLLNKRIIEPSKGVVLVPNSVTPASVVKDLIGYCCPIPSIPG